MSVWLGEYEATDIHLKNTPILSINIRHSIVSIGNDIYLFGGIDEDDKRNDLYVLSLGNLHVNYLK